MEKQDLRLKFPEKPKTNRNNYGVWKDYRVLIIYDHNEIGHLTLTRKVRLRRDDFDDFWHDLSKNPPAIRTVVCFQETEERFRERGISGLALELANEAVKEMSWEPLSSDTTFVCNPSSDLGYHPHPAKRVWIKLTKEGKAIYSPFKRRDGIFKDRYVMI